MKHQYIWDNHFAERALRTIDWVLNNRFPRAIAISFAHSKINLLRELTTNTMDYIISGKGPYWQILPHVILNDL